MTLDPRAAARLRDIMTGMRAVPADGRDFAWFEHRDELKGLGVHPDDIDGHDTSDAAIEHNIRLADAAAGNAGRRADILAAAARDDANFHLLPSQAYQDCLGEAVGGDGTFLGNALAGAGLAIGGTKIMSKPRTGLGGGGPSGKMTTPIRRFFAQYQDPISVLVRRCATWAPRRPKVERDRRL